MKFTKSKGLAVSIVIALLAVINIVAFMIPTFHTLTFWLGYSFATLAALLTLAVMLFLFNPQTPQQLFGRLSIPVVAWVYFVIQAALGVGQILNAAFPYLTALLVNCCVTGVFLITVLLSHAAVDTIEKQEAHVNEKVLFLENLKLTVQGISTSNAVLSAKLETLAEDIQFSDPMSHSMLSELEKQIEAKIVLLKSEITNEETALAAVEAIRTMLQERNRKCMMLKRVKEEPKASDNTGAKYMAVTVGVAGLIAAMVLAICFWVIPNGVYRTAVTLYEAGRYEEAIVTFKEVNGFRNSGEMIVLAEEAIKETVYQEAMTLFQIEQYDKAIALFAQISGYKDSDTLALASENALNDIAYEAAKTLYEAEKYEEALVAFEALGDYKDSATMVSACKEAAKEAQYLAAEEHFNNQRYVEAIAGYTALGDYKDSKQKIEKIYNRLADEDGVVYFGSYNGKPIAWEIAKAESDKLLLIAKEAVTSLPYHEELKAVAWNDSTLCRWLNTEFIKSFSEEQRASIMPTTVDGQINSLFLFNDAEANSWEFDYTMSIEGDWWLRTNEDGMALYVDADGDVNGDGENVNRSKGVRPVMWFNLK